MCTVGMWRPAGAVEGVENAIAFRNEVSGAKLIGEPDEWGSCRNDREGILENRERARNMVM